MDVSVSRFVLAATVACYAWFWTWFVWSVIDAPGAEVAWISLFGFLVAIDHANHVWLLWIAPRFEKIRKDSKADRSDRPRRVAMIVTKAPSEPFEVVRKTLEAMLAQDVPNGASADVWVADERPSEDTLAWCAENGVRVSSRHGRDDYHLPEWPKRTKCKEGNLRFWYDANLDNYDVVCQFDADHAPRANYLREVLWRFNDPKVGYVAAPNVSTNSPCWFGRARRDLEAPYYGSFLGSLSARSDDSSFFMPSCTGSHYAVSSDAIRAIGGGLGPELDEDLSTTMMISKAGFVGSYAVDALADGDGPETLEDGLVQEMQWSRSATLLFTRWFSTVFPGRGAPIGSVVRSALIALWYATLPLWLIWFVGGPIVAMYSGWCIATDGPDSSCSFNMVGLVVHATPVWFVNIGWEAYQKRRGWFRPVDSPAFSFKTIPYRALRVLYMTIGVAAGLVQLLVRKTPAFRVTNKGSNAVRRLAWKTLFPIYFIMASFAAVFWTSIAYEHRDFNGFYVWFGQLALASVAIVCFVGHAVEQKGSLFAGKAFAIDAILHVFTISSGIASVVLSGALSVSRSLVFSSSVTNAVWIPHWTFSSDMWISIGFLSFSTIFMFSVPFLSKRANSERPAFARNTESVPVSTGASAIDPSIPVIVEELFELADRSL